MRCGHPNVLVSVKIFEIGVKTFLMKAGILKLRLELPTPSVTIIIFSVSVVFIHYVDVGNALTTYCHEVILQLVPVLCDVSYFIGHLLGSTLAL